MSIRDNENNIMEAERIAAMLALRLGELNKQSDTPVSDEQLAAFVDGTLQGEGRKAVMAMLVQDEDAYNRWVRLVEACYDNPVDEAIKNHVTEAKQNGWSFRQWWSQWFGGPLVFVPAMAVVLMAVSVFIYQNDEVDRFSDLNALATKYPINQDLLNTSVAMRGGSVKLLHDFPEWKQQIFKGAKLMLDELNQSGIDASNKYANHPLSVVSDDISIESEGLIALGAWALTTDVLCTTSVPAGAVNKLNQLHQQIPIIDPNKYPNEFSVLWAAYPKNGTQAKVCAYASNVIAP